MRLPHHEEDGGILTVSKLNQQIKTLLEAHFPFVWVRGEISNFRVPASGHFYFTLKDEHSQVPAVFFRQQNRFLRYVPQAGMEVICQARLSVYEPRGEYQIIVEVMEPAGVGALQLAFEQLKKKLEAEGLFDHARKKPFPLCPQNICIVTSRTGAAIRDILKLFERSPYPLNVTLFPVAVQGAEASREISQAVAAANALAGEHQWDVMIVGRGGGSLEDLWSFNEEAVARAISESSIPVISAVGHEIDFTIADLVADMRMPTPSAAAEWVVGRLEKFHRDLHGFRDRVTHVFRQRLDTLAFKLKFLESRVTHPKRRLEDLKLLLDDRIERLELALNRRMERCRTLHSHLGDRLLHLNPGAQILRHRAELDRQSKELILQHQRILDGFGLAFQRNLSRLETLSPLGVLNRGYSIAYRAKDRKIIRKSIEVAAGDKVIVRLAEGRLDCTVDGPRDLHDDA
ncbi:MAG: exodeoxyribonuclease VII large subunit [Syntrophobacteraceae bacterium]